MAKVLVNESSLTGIADAIRGKNGSTDTYKPSEMAAAITAISGGGPDIPDSAFVISGECQYRFANNGWNWFIEQYGDRITTKDISNANNMFVGSTQFVNIPFELNFDNKYSSHSTGYLFSDCDNLITLPRINNLKVFDTSNMFKSCYRLRTIPEDFADSFDWSYLESQTSMFTGNQNGMFFCCYSLRSFPFNLINRGNPNAYYSYSYFINSFYECYSLDELVNLPIPYINTTWTGNAFNNTFRSCSRLKNMTFALNDGQPHIMNWKSQTIDLSSTTIGYASNSSKNYILNYNSGITADKEVTDDATYQALKNDADWFTTNVAYSRYNHDSAVATINSLPDTSAYLASAGGTNTIKFNGASGSATDGGAINTLTEEEIAVATAKGWTVTLV